MLPTAARTVAAVCLFILAWMVSEQIKLLYPEGKDFGWFNVVNGLVGFLCGWIIIGTRVGRGWSAAISNGVTATVAMVFWGLFLQAANEMTRLAMRNRYDGFFEAIVAIFQIMIDFGMSVLVPHVLLTLFVGGCVTGILSEWTSRHWR